MVLPDVLGTKVGRLVAAEFADPHRLAALGVSRFIRFAANRGLRVRRSAAERLVAAARAALPSSEARVARQVLADDLVLLACLDAQIVAAEAKLAQLLPDTPFAALTTVPGWGTVRAANYGAAVGEQDRWPGARQLYRASGLSPAQYESAGKRRDGSISREGSVRFAAGADRPRDRAMACRHGRPTLRPTAAGSRQEGRGDRLRDGKPREQDRLRDGPRPVRLRPRPLGLTAAGDSSIAAHSVARSSGQLGAPAAQRGRTRLTAASSDAQYGGEEAPGKELTWPFHNQACR